MDFVDRNNQPITSIGVGQTATLRYTIENPNPQTAYADISHSFFPGMAVAAPLNVNETCSGSNFTISPGDLDVLFSGVVVMQGGTCTLSIDVTFNAAGSFSTSTSPLGGFPGGNAASATLSVTDPAPVFTMAFLDNSGATATVFAPGEIATIVYTVDARANTGPVKDFELSHVFPAGLTAATSPNASTTCIAGKETFSVLPNANSWSVRGYGVNGGQSCVFRLDVTSSAEGAYKLATGSFYNSVTTVPPATGTLTFENDTVPPRVQSIMRHDPTAYTTNEDALTWLVTFNEAINVGTVSADDFALTGSTANLSINRVNATTFEVTASGGDLAELDGLVSLSPNLPSTIEDLAGNVLVSNLVIGFSENFYQVRNDETAPFLIGFERFDPSGETTDADELVFKITFSETVRNVSAEHFQITGTTATGVLSGGTPDNDRLAQTTFIEGPQKTEQPERPVLRRGDEFFLTVSGGDLAELEGNVGLDLRVTKRVEPGLAYRGQTIGMMTEAGPPGIGVFVPSIFDDAGNRLVENEPSTDEAYTLTQTLDNTAPSVTIELPDTEATGAFTATFTFSEDVTGFELADLIVANGVASDLSRSGDTYTATITPQVPGEVTITVAEGAVTDEAGLSNLEASASIQAISSGASVEVVLSSETADPGSVVASAKISNPGSEPLPFVASVDVPWMDVTPTTGTISPLGQFDISVSLNEGVNALTPGDYRGTVTVTVGTAPAVSGVFAGGADGQPVQAAGEANPLAAQLTSGTVLVELPINVEIQQRYGSLQLVATTPAGLSGDERFTYASSLPEFDGLTLATTGGRASASSEKLIFGSYTLTQSAPSGWRVESFACSGDADGGTTFNAASDTATIDVDPGESLVCTYQNVRDEDAIRLATQRTIRNFMVRRADRVIESSPDLSRRFAERGSIQRGGMSADVTGAGRYQMSLSASLAGMRNAAAAEDARSEASFGSGETPFLENWDIWLAAEASGVEDNRADEKAKSDFALIQLGVDYLVREDLIVGAMAQYDWMDETSGEVFAEAGAISGAQVEGKGWMAGPYAVWTVRDTLVFDGLAMYGQSDNKVNPLGLYSDDFDTDRLLLRASLTGEFTSGPWRLRPQAVVTHFEERQDAYTDRLGIAIPGQDITLGRLRAGPQLIWHNASPDGGWVELSARVDGVWDYDAAELLNASGRLVGGAGDLRADVRFGFAAQLKSGPLVRFELGMGGFGTGDFEARTGRLEIRIPFGPEGLASAAALAAGPAMGVAGNCDGPRYGMGAAMQGMPSCGAGFR